MSDEKKVSVIESFMELMNKTKVTLADTTDLMNSEDYKERFIAEYYQLKIRYDSLNTMIVKIKAGTLDFTPKCPVNTLEDQLYYMNDYMKILRIRAEIEGINLFDIETEKVKELPKEEIPLPDPEPVVDDQKDKEEENNESTI